MFRILGFIIVSASFSQAQQLIKDCYDSKGNRVEESQSEYCVIGKKVLRVDPISGFGEPLRHDTVETYIDTVQAYFTKINKTKFLKIYNKSGFLDGNFIEYFPNGKLKQRGNYKDGHQFGFATQYYPNGKPQSSLQYFLEEQNINETNETHFKIMNYWDSLGSQIVAKGSGFCKCFLVSGRKEIGKVVDGFRDSIWSEYSGDTLILKEEYKKGKLLKGHRFINGKAYEYSSFAEQPEYPGGHEKLMETIRKNLEYPIDARRSATEGTVYVSFVVKTTGEISDIKISRGISRSLDNEALRVIKLLKKWSPGLIRGTPVNISYNMPIKFKLN